MFGASFELANVMEFAFNLVRFSSSFDYFKLGLGANPLRCDCDIRWLHELLRGADSFRLSGLSWTCDSGRRFADLTDADFASCPPPSQPNCSVVAPPPDAEFENSTSGGGEGELPIVLRVGFHSCSQKRGLCVV